MKKFFGVFILLLLLTAFGLFLKINYGSNEVLKIITPTKLVIDINNNKIQDPGETICIPEIEAFTTDYNKEFYDKYHKKFNLTKDDFINMGYLADEYFRKLVLNKNVVLRKTQKTTSECDYANIIINNINYTKYLINSGFGIFHDKIGNDNKFKENLAQSRKLNLVIYNHKSNIYHKLNCEYGNMAHDKVYLPLKQLPHGAKPCNFCHKSKHKTKRKKVNKPIRVINNYEIPNTPLPPLEVHNGDISLYLMDFTHNFKPNNNCITPACKAIVSKINDAKENIDIAIFGYEEIPEITNTLKDARSRGVSIRYVYDEASNPKNTYYKNNNILLDIANEFSNDLKSNETNKIMHNKFIIIDNQIVITGSMNFSKTSTSGYDNNDILIINSPQIAQLYKAEFEQMINGKFHNAKDKLNLNNEFVLQDSKIEIYFSPKDKQSRHIINYISKAKDYIYIPTLLITHSKIVTELVNAHNRGVDVKIILDANSTSTKHIKYNTLRNSGIPLKMENYAGKLHSKSMIIDDKYIITGSMNFSNSGENHNDENTVIISNQKIAKFYKEFFMYLWSVIPDKYLKINPPAEGKESIGSCFDGIDNNFNGKIDAQDPLCK